MLSGIDGIDADSNLGALEDGTEPLLAFLYGFFVADSLGDIAECDHHADHRTVLPDRRGGIFDWKTSAVFSPKHFIRGAAALSIQGGLVHPAILAGVWGSIGVRVVHQRVHWLADQLRWFITEHPCARGIHKRRRSVCVNATDAVRNRSQN